MGYTDHQVQWLTTCIDSVSARAAQLEDGWSHKWIVWGEQSHAYIIKHPIETQLLLAMEYTDIRYSDIIRVLILWVQSSTTEDGWSPMNCVGEAVSCLIIKHPIETHWLLAMEYTDIRYVTLLRVLILWVPELENWGRMVSKCIVWGEQSHAYIIKHPIETPLTLVMEYTDIGTVTLLRVLILWVQSSTTGGRWSPNELCGGGESLLT